MAAKRPNPKEDPPAASSSEEEEDDSSTDDEDSKASSDEEHPPLSQTPSKKPVVQDSDSESESDSSTDSDSDPAPNLHNVKPIASKPKPQAHAAPAAAAASASASAASKLGTKRGSETEREAKDAKRQKEVAVRDEDVEGKNEDAPRALFQRLWGESDEIAVLSGLIEFADKRGADPLKDMAAFYDSIKKSLSVDVSLSQLKEKVTRLRKKFKNHANGTKGLDKSFSKAHDQKCFDLSKQIWDSQGEVLRGRVTDGKSNGKAKKSGGSSSKSASKAAADLGAENGDVKAKSKGGGSDGGNSNGGASKAIVGAGEERMEIAVVSPKDGFSLDWCLTGAEVEDFVVKKGLDIVEGSQRNELARRWKELDTATLKLFIQRNQLITDQARAILDRK